jgi:hypothetical protein
MRVTRKEWKWLIFGGITAILTTETHGRKIYQ